MPGSRLRRWTVRLDPGTAIEYAAADWADALVVVESGEVEVECCSGQCARFAAGAVLTLVALPLRRLRNPHAEPVVLSAVARWDPDR